MNNLIFLPDQKIIHRKKPIHLIHTVDDYSYNYLGNSIKNFFPFLTRLIGPTYRYNHN